MTWVKRWQIPSKSTAGKFYTVAIDIHGAYGCDCPAWKFKKERVDCKHIFEVKNGWLGVGEESGMPLAAKGWDGYTIATEGRGAAAERVAEKRAERVAEVSGLEALRVNAKWGIA